MRKILIIFFCLIAYLQIDDNQAIAINYSFGDVGAPGPNDVHLGQTGIMMPLEKIILLKKNSEYCAIKFTKFWSENQSEKKSVFVATGADEYALYESYSMTNKTGDFAEKNIRVKKEKLSFTKPRGIGRLAFVFGNNKIGCGTIRLSWYGGGYVPFLEEGQHEGPYGIGPAPDSIELAPTPWTDIKEININDPRIKWYKYDVSRKRVNVPIDKLWK